MAALARQHARAPSQIHHLLIGEFKVLIGVQTTSQIPHGDHVAVAMHHFFHERVGAVNAH